MFTFWLPTVLFFGEREKWKSVNVLRAQSVTDCNLNPSGASILKSSITKQWGGVFLLRVAAVGFGFLDHWDIKTFSTLNLQRHFWSIHFASFQITLICLGWRHLVQDDSFLIKDQFTSAGKKTMRILKWVLFYVT